MAAPASEIYLSTSRFGALDGLRCLSILAVIWHHTGGRAFPDSTFLQRGGYGVWLFFVVSGFLITTLLKREKRRRGHISLKKFMARRALRIFPLYYTVLAVYCGLVFVLERDSVAGQGFFQNLKYFLTYSSNWFVPLDDGRIIFYFAWSLATEEQFYLVWPWAEKLLHPGFATALILALVALAFAFDQAPFAAVGCGVILAHGLDDPRSFSALAKVIGGRFACLAFLALVVALTAWEPSPAVAIIAAMTLLVGACTLREDSALAPFLEVKPFVQVGQVSYGMYLLHMLAYNVVRKGLAMAGYSIPVGEFALTTLVTYGVAKISYVYYESIFLRLKDRYAA